MLLFPLPGTSGGLEQILSTTARDTPDRLNFTERREDPLLEGAETLTGRLEFLPPDILVRTVDGPRGETVRIKGSRLTVARNGTVRRELRLDEQPPLAAFVTAFRALVGNDPNALRTHYEVELNGDVADWQLRLVPRDRALRRLMPAMEMHGGDGMLHQVIIREAGGHESHMRLEPAREP